jgi:DNA-binding LytR/AlgR family response regulator
MEKPFDLNVMKNILMELIMRRQAEEYRQKLTDSTLFVSSEGVLYPIKEDDIIYMEFHSRNSVIITRERSYKTQKAWMEGCLRGLDTTRFISCSRYETVNLDYVESIDFRDGVLHLKGMDKMIKIGRNGRKNLQERINFRK